jgi:hypothetical protein
MHEHHEVFDAPSNIDVPVWRYMDLTKFISMLETEALHFARASGMSDQFEGSTSKVTYEARRKAISSAIPAGAGSGAFIKSCGTSAVTSRR